ncbi:MAG: peptidoglycan-binding domain-containing protein [Jatrophihabitans sp.]|uniref:peptidoglycan-binding domain-containing protein n=1 Tax=Jatrophihabitans sp. TaxID=1932789 RepID=UPI003F81AD8F
MRSVRALLTLPVLLATLLAGTGSASAAVAAPHTPAGLPTAIEPLASYAEQTACNPVPRPGTLKLANLLKATYPDTSYATVYACGTDGTRSEHYDGRAIDWMVSALNAHSKAEAQAVLTWLLATDAQGNRFAMARRLGVQYLIFDNRMWGSWSGTWEQYNGCYSLKGAAYDNSCHRTHMHISLGWNGANGLTTFWTKQVSATDYGPCVPAGLNWATFTGRRNTVGCPTHATVTAPASASALKKTLVYYSGAPLRRGWLGGPAVTAVQQALHIPATGVFDLTTRLAVQHFQAAHGIPTFGLLTNATWRALLAATR